MFEFIGVYAALQPQFDIISKPTPFACRKGVSPLTAIDTLIRCTTFAQSKWLERTVQLVAHHARLNPGPTLLSVYLKDVAPVSTDVGHDALTDHLSGQLGASRMRNDVGVT